MKRFILGAVFGILLSATTITYASDSIKTLLFPAKFEFNGKNTELGDEYKVLNYNGHAYVPIRFVTENIGATIDYDPETEIIFVKNGNLDLSDPDWSGISVGNLILTKDGPNTKVTGHLKMEKMGNEKNMVGANLSFYKDDQTEKIGEVAITGTNFGNKTQTFEAIGEGDFRTYSTVKLHIGAVNYRITGGGPGK
ncbi:stalk domain-containing protein [Paenibacillus sp. N3.4]|uniref:stalk domain-containing protein n=1 Tax=Paenibacillus sp. N3.4 TaxID=2603222 RepID=UPI00164F782C|nr:stalk domain-containing protein [Paenibacillus sp. N3.4]